VAATVYHPNKRGEGPTPSPRLVSTGQAVPEALTHIRLLPRMGLDDAGRGVGQAVCAGRAGRGVGEVVGGTTGRTFSHRRTQALQGAEDILSPLSLLALTRETGLEVALPRTATATSAGEGR